MSYETPSEFLNGGYESGFQDSFDQGGPIDSNSQIKPEVINPKPRSVQIFTQLLEISKEFSQPFDGKFLIDFDKEPANIFSANDLKIGVNSGFLEHINESLYEFDINRDPREVSERTKEWIERVNRTEQ